MHFIDSEASLEKAKCLIGMELIGVDAEWRPGMTTFQQSKPALFQVGGLEQVCLFDMVALANNKALDELLEKAFTQAGSVVIGFSFHNDLKAFAKSFPEMRFYRRFACLIDLQQLFSEMYAAEKSMGLSKVTDYVIGKPICKGEQMSNWERRPLRSSQTHYAALDAYIMAFLYRKMD